MDNILQPKTIFLLLRKRYLKLSFMDKLLAFNGSYRSSKENISELSESEENDEEHHTETGHIFCTLQ
jgi:hypothetical protein